MKKVLITGGNGNIATIITNHLQHEYDISNPSHQELDILDMVKLTKYFKTNKYDILIHTAILGGRRTKTENYDVVYKNLLMFENLMKFADSFKMIINLDSAAIYDRQTDILDRKETELFTIPDDFYGFSKYVIYQRSLNYEHIYNFRIFNIFHSSEESDRFIKSCFLAKRNNTKITIYEDKYFDFVYEDDFVKILKYYIDNLSNSLILYKTINICYSNKYTLSDIAAKIVPNENINILSNELTHNYSGDGNLLNSIISLDGLEVSLEKYESIFNISN